MEDIHFLTRVCGDVWEQKPACGMVATRFILVTNPGTVTCPACRETEAWRKADREARALPLLGGGAR